MQAKRISEELTLSGIECSIIKNINLAKIKDGNAVSADYDFCVFLDKDKAAARLLEKCGVKTVKLNLGDGSGEDRAGEENPSEWTCRDAAIYFEHQADEIGEQMEQGRRWFSYGAIKQRYRECFLEKG